MFGLAVVMGLAMPLAWAGQTPELKRGVNLSHWLQFGGRQPIESADMRMIRSAGFDSVRIPFDPELLSWNPDAASPTINWTTLDQAVNLALQANLEVILDFHQGDLLSKRIQNDETVRAAYLNFMEAMAKHFSGTPSSKVAFELLNEPSYWESDGPARLSALEKEAVARIRVNMPSHLLLLPGAHGGFISGLVLMTPVADSNVRYVFHYYFPHLFTHLNAPFEPFLSGVAGMITNLVYPAKDALKQVKLVAGADATAALAAVTQYEQENWGPERIKADIGQAQAWAVQNRVTLICTEFGVVRFGTNSLRPGPDNVSRRKWLNDSRTAFEAFGIGWSIWNYADGYGIATVMDSIITPWSDPIPVPRDPLNPKRAFEEEDLRALGVEKKIPTPQGLMLKPQS
jgi:endoglucanase